MVVMTRFQHPEAQALWDRLTAASTSKECEEIWLEAGWWFGGERDELTPREEEEFGKVYAAASTRRFSLLRVERLAAEGGT